MFSAWQGPSKHLLGKAGCTCGEGPAHLWARAPMPCVRMHLQVRPGSGVLQSRRLRGSP